MPPNQPNQFPQPQQQPPVQQPEVPPDYSIDYLNEISGPYKPPNTGPSKLVLIIAGLVGLLSVIGFVLMLTTSGPSNSDKALDVYLRIDTLKTVAEDQQSNLRDNDLRGLNSNLTLQLSNALGASAEPFGAIGVDTTKVDKNRVAKEALVADELTAAFDEAELNVRLDTVYAREMSFQLETLRAMMESVYRQTNSTSLQTYLDQTASELQTISDNFSDFITD